MVKSACNTGDVTLIPVLGWFPGEGNGSSLQYSCLENPRDRGAWQLQSMKLHRLGHGWETEHTCAFLSRACWYTFIYTEYKLDIVSTQFFAKNNWRLQTHSVQCSHSVMSDSLQPHELQHARPPCSSLTPGDYSNSCPSSWWCHPTISSSVIPFSSCPQSLPASGSFPMSQFFAWGGQSTGVSASASVLPMNTQGWSPLGWTGWISLQSKGLSRVFSNTTVQKHQFFGAQLSSQSNSHMHPWPLEEP